MGIDWRTRIAGLVLIATLLPLAISSGRYGDAKDEESMNDGDRIFIFANVVRPLKSTCEQYPYFDFPFCPPGEPITNRTSSLHDLLTGDCYTNTQYKLTFKKKVARKILCEKSLTKSEVAKFRDAVKRKFVSHFAFQKGLLQVEMGRTEVEEDQKPKYYLATHISFYIKYYRENVIDVLIMRDPDSDVDITKVSKMKVNFTYSVSWEKTLPSRPIPLMENEMNWKYSRRWMSFSVHSASTVLVWFTIVSVTLAYLWSYFTRYVKDEKYSDVELTLGPRYIHGENCNCPRYTSLLGAVLGNGIQLLITVCVLFILGYNGLLNTCDFRSLCFDISRMHCLLSAVAGYIATSFHTRFTQIGWKVCIFQAATIYVVPVLLTALLANHLAITRHGISVPDRSIIFENMVRWEIPSIGIICLGGFLGRYFRPESQPPCATARLVKEIPQQPWYTNTLVQILFGALIPSAVIYPKMDYIYASLWKLKLCGAFSSVLGSFMAAIVLTVVIAIGFTNFQLASHDHRWWWRSFFRGGLPAVFVFGYGIFFFCRFESDHGLLVCIFGYNACISYALFMILGTTSFYASCMVHSTYNLQKHE